MRCLKMIKTILDLKRYKELPNADTVYDLDSIDDILLKIQKLSNQDLEYLFVKSISKDLRKDLENLYGFKIWDNKIYWTGYSRWVYFLDNVPIYFASSCSQTDTAPQLRGPYLS